MVFRLAQFLMQPSAAAQQMRVILKAWDVGAVFAIAVAAVVLAVVFDQSPLLVFTLVAFALCAYTAMRFRLNDHD
jgi:hypothetical protein